MIPDKEGDVILIPVDRIRVINPRVRDQAKFARIVYSIEKLGLKKPITVTANAQGPDGTQTYNLVCGQGRLEAFQRLGQREIPALVRNLSKPDSLLASLIENIARRRVRGTEQIKMIQWMQDQGNSYAEIAQRTALSEDYVKDILNMIRQGEDRLLEAVLNGKIPVTIAVRIAEGSDEQAQRALMEAYERKDMNQKTLTAFKRVLDQRRHFGRSYGSRRSRGAQRTSAESLVRAYRLECQRQKLMVKKAKLCEVRLLSVSAAFRVLVMDDDYINLLRAEQLETMPKFLAERAQQSA
ncbi:MAG: ParB N-terminal domain-containing protein [Opitutaceae bacterium]|nr:ParB N-terminal domain-containing protein [Opitutaceae bacterium]